MGNEPKINMEMRLEEGGTMTLIFSGRLDTQTTAQIWQESHDLIEKQKPARLIVDAKAVDYCDSAGIALFEMLEEMQTADQHTFHLACLAENFQQLMAAIKHPQTSNMPHPPEKEVCTRFSFLHFINEILENLHDNVYFLGMLSYQIIGLFKTPQGVRWKDFGTALEDVGPRALPIILLSGLLIGLISTFQSAAPMGRFGTQIYIINLVGLGLVREMGPLITAILLAGRTASSFAAEIGTMKINQELDALTTMGLSPVKFLTIPRILATAIMTPLLNIFLIIAALIGCAIVMHTLGYNLHIYLNQLEGAVTLKDFIGGSIKGFAFGIVIASIGCLNGLKTKLNSSAVGHATTRAVVSSLMMIILVDGLFAYIYYILGV